MNKKTIITIGMIVLTLVMAVGYAVFSTNLVINGTANIESNWSVEFTKIEQVSKTSGVTIKATPTATGTSATFNVDLTSPGDKIEYKITVTNKGTLNAIIKDIKASETGSDAIIFEITNIKVGDKLSAKASTTFNVTISYDNSITSQPNITDNKLTIAIDYVQDVGQTITTENIDITPTRLYSKILAANTAQSDANIDFSKTSEEDGTKGLYYTSTNTEDNRTVYYFRGAVENNYVSFAEQIWRIVRINEDGSIRLVIEKNLGSSIFNPNTNDNVYVGYMYGTAGSLNYAETHKNTNNSTIKGILDTWYTKHLSSYSSMFSQNAGFCNDRSIAEKPNTWHSDDTAFGFGTNATRYGAYNRLYNNNIPQFACPQTNDLFTISTSSKGNKKLANPIGLLTLDEVVYAGGKVSTTNNNYYLNNGEAWWTMSPRGFDSYRARVWYVNYDGLVGYGSVDVEGGVRPVIDLASSVEILDNGSDGTVTKPYTIKVS